MIQWTDFEILYGVKLLALGESFSGELTLNLCRLSHMEIEKAQLRKLEAILSQVSTGNKHLFTQETQFYHGFPLKNESREWLSES